MSGAIVLTIAVVAFVVALTSGRRTKAFGAHVAGMGRRLAELEHAGDELEVAASVMLYPRGIATEDMRRRALAAAVAEWRRLKGWPEETLRLVDELPTTEDDT